MSTEARDIRTGGRAPDGASPDAIESTLSSNREAIDRTLTEIQERLSAEGLMHTAMERLRSESGMQFMRGLRDTVVHNPMPVTVIALGMVWAAMSDRTGQSGPRGMGRGGSGSDEQIGRQSGETQIGSQSSGTRRDRLQGAGGRAREFMGRGRTGLARAGGSAAARSRDSASRGWQFTREHPVLMAGAGIAFGAALAALLPTTRMERERVGPVRDEAVRGSTRFASEAGRGASSGFEGGFEAQERQTATQTGAGDRGPAERGTAGTAGDRGPTERAEGQEPYSGGQADAGERGPAERRPS